MSSDDLVTERVPADAGTRSAVGRRPVVHTWQGTDPARLESVRLLLGEARLRASGRLVAAADPVAATEAYSASFEASVDVPGDQAGRLLLRTTTAEHERQISLSRSEDGLWLVDDGRQTRRAEFDGSRIVDVPGAVTCAIQPIRHFGLHREPGEVEIPVVSVSLPDLTVTVVRHHYRTVTVGPDGATVTLVRGGASVDVTVDADGVVLDFPGVAHRV